MILSPPMIGPKTAKDLLDAAKRRSARTHNAPTYIVDDKNDDFYKAAWGYYESWGYRKPVAVKSMEDVIGHLAKGRNVDHLRIVTHGGFASSEQSMELAMFRKSKGRPTLGTKWTGSQELLLADPGRFVAAMLDDLLSSSELGALAGATRLAAPQGSLVGKTPFFAKLSDATITAAKNAGLLAQGIAIEETQDYQWSSVRSAIAAVAVLTLLAKYRESPDGSLKEGEVEWIEALFTDLKSIGLAQSTTTKRAEFETFLALYEDNAKRLIVGVSAPGKILRRFVNKQRKAPLEEARAEGQSRGSFFTKLAKAREALSPGAEVEIRGCNIGRDRTMMGRLRDLFTMQRATGGVERRPIVSAPTLFQVFTKMAVHGFTTTKSDEPPSTNSTVARLSRDAEGLAKGRFIVNMSEETRSFDQVTGDFDRGTAAFFGEEQADKFRRMKYRADKVQRFNPDLDLQKIRPFERVWLRPVTDEEREAYADRKPIEGLNAYLNRTSTEHQLLARATGGAPMRNKTLEGSIKEWARRFLGEELTGGVKGSLYITYLTAHSNMPPSPRLQAAGVPLGGGDLKTTDPILFPGQRQFWRHINFTA